MVFLSNVVEQSSQFWLKLLLVTYIKIYFLHICQNCHYVLIDGYEADDLWEQSSSSSSQWSCGHLQKYTAPGQKQLIKYQSVGFSVLSFSNTLFLLECACDVKIIYIFFLQPSYISETFFILFLPLLTFCLYLTDNFCLSNNQCQSFRHKSCRMCSA